MYIASIVFAGIAIIFRLLTLSSRMARWMNRAWVCDVMRCLSVTVFFFSLCDLGFIYVNKAALKQPQVIVFVAFHLQRGDLVQEAGYMELSAKQRKEQQEKLLKEISARYEAELDPLFAAARLWVDGIIDPADTRGIISRAIGMASNNPEIGRFNPGVIQV